MKIYIDPGHGESVTGKYDPGAVGPTGLRENDVAFDIAQRLGHLARAQGIGTLGATLGAAKDTENLNEAIHAANSEQADYYVSIHCNAATDPRARGVEVWYSQHSGAKALAETVLARIVAQIAGGKGSWLKGKSYPLNNRGVKLGTFAVLRETHMPAILVEVAFISNSQEEAWLRDNNVRQQFAQAIADGIGDLAKK